MKNIKQISPQESKFLQRTTVIDKPPKCLWYVGTIPEPLPTVAIVGSRKPTSYGREISGRLVSELAKHGVIIVSGLAIGHDALAHRACLEAGGKTVAVIGNGLENPHPHANHALAERIVENGGAIISEYPPDAPVYKENFLQRNRLISALADIVIVIEAGEHSGTLNTASHAIQQGKEVMAVPGNVTSPLSVGCNRLIAQGAAPILSSQDVLDHLGIRHELEEQKTTRIRFDSPESQKVYDLILSGEHDGDRLAKLSNLDAADFMAALTMLELNAYIQPLGGNQWGVK